MALRIPRRSVHQLQLFLPRPRQPQWVELPLPIRRKALPLLASLLRAAQAIKEASDER